MGKAYGNCCVYCGDWFESRDHVVPVAWSTPRRYYNQGEVVACCKLCNRLLGSKSYHTIPDRAEYLYVQYTKRYSRFAKFPKWTEHQLDEMGWSLRMSILAKMYLKELLAAKIDNTERVMFGWPAKPLHDTETSLILIKHVEHDKKSARKLSSLIQNEFKKSRH